MNGSKNSKSIGIDEHKKALARALLIIVRNRKKFNDIGSGDLASDEREKIFSNNYDKLFKDSRLIKRKNESRMSANELIDVIAKELGVDHAQKEANKKITGVNSDETAGTENRENNAAEPVKNQATGTTGEAQMAKDFNGEQPKSIYAYAIQKAKKLQER